MQKVIVKLRRLREDFGAKLDKSNLRFLDRTTAPVDFPQLRFVTPTRGLKTEMRRGPNREPETREWIEQIPKVKNSVLWDIGANVGSFTVFAASLGLRVVAVEPMPHNLLLLARNLFLNHVEDQVTLLPLAIALRTGPSVMRLSSQEFGSARHRFTSSRDQSSDAFPQFGLSGVSLSDACLLLGLPRPTHLKIDVDGTDDEVVFSAEPLLDQVEGICCEVNFEEERVEYLTRFLEKRGLKVAGRSRRNMFFCRPDLREV